MPKRYAFLVGALPLWLPGIVPGLAQASDRVQAADPVAASSFWPLLLPNAAVVLVGLGWVLLMTRRRG